VHPSDQNEVHELYLMCANVEAFVPAMKGHGIVCGPVQNLGWGLLTQLTLPGGGKLGVYQPRHARPKPMRAAKPPRKRIGRRGTPKAPRKGARPGARRR
jgi:hypothetical protein